MPANGRPSEDRAPWRAVYALAWASVLAVYVLLFTQMGAAPGRALRAALASLLPAAALGLPIVSLRLPPPRTSSLGALGLAHAFRAVAFAVVTTAAWGGLAVLDQAATGGTLATVQAMLRRNAGFQALWGSLLYGVVAAVGQARRDGIRYREQRDLAARAEALRARAELSALRSQLNPHFILNALHTLLALVRRDPGKAEEAIDELGRLLTYGLRMHRDGLDLLPLDEEWRFVAGYARIEQLRFGDRLRVTLDADPGALACLVPPFSVQPLVENAILHGITPLAAGGTVAVSARALGKRVRITVEDDGRGCEPSMAGPGTGLGLRLLQERLRALYGTRAVLSVGRGTAGGTSAVLEVPGREAEEEEAG